MSDRKSRRIAGQASAGQDPVQQALAALASAIENNTKELRVRWAELIRAYTRKQKTLNNAKQNNNNDHDDAMSFAYWAWVNISEGVLLASLGAEMPDLLTNLPKRISLVKLQQLLRLLPATRTPASGSQGDSSGDITSNTSRTGSD